MLLVFCIVAKCRHLGAWQWPLATCCHALGNNPWCPMETFPKVRPVGGLSGGALFPKTHSTCTILHVVVSTNSQVDIQDVYLI